MQRHLVQVAHTEGSPSTRNRGNVGKRSDLDLANMNRSSWNLMRDSIGRFCDLLLISDCLARRYDADMGCELSSEILVIGVKSFQEIIYYLVQVL